MIHIMHSLNSLCKSSDIEYQRIADAIAQLAEDTGNPPLILSLCEWGEESVNLISVHDPCPNLRDRNNPGCGPGDMVKAGV